MTSPTKIPIYSQCSYHHSNILYYCNDCDIGICEYCRLSSLSDHIIYDINFYYNKTYMELPFKNFIELDEYID